jgi:hypothetical protein
MSRRGTHRKRTGVLIPVRFFGKSAESAKNKGQKRNNRRFQGEKRQRKTHKKRRILENGERKDFNLFASYTGIKNEQDSKYATLQTCRSVWRVRCTAQFPYLDAWKVFKECREGRVGIRLPSVYGPANTTSSKTLITYIRVTTPVPNVVAANVFGTGIVH